MTIHQELMQKEGELFKQNKFGRNIRRLRPEQSENLGDKREKELQPRSYQPKEALTILNSSDVS